MRISTAYREGYLEKDTVESIIESLEAIGRMLQGMIDKSHLFCQPRQTNDGIRPEGATNH